MAVQTQAAGRQIAGQPWAALTWGATAECVATLFIVSALTVPRWRPVCSEKVIRVDPTGKSLVVAPR